MAFDSLTSLIVMEGHGPYVWTCYGVFFLLLGALVYWSLLQRRRVVSAQRRDMARAAAGQSATPQAAVGASFNRVHESQD